MASKYQSKSAAHIRRKQNRGTAHGTRRVGAGGRVVRQWNAKTARWDKVGPAKRQGLHGQVARIPGSGKDGVNASTSSGTMKTSGSPVTETKGVRVNVDRLERARSRQSAVKKAGIYGAGLTVPVTRIPTFLTGAAQLGSAFGKSPAGRSLGKTIKKQAQRPGRWWSGY